MNDIISETAIDFLVEEFYTKIQKNEVLAPFFINTNWEHHLPRMKQFWCFILLDKPGFKGNIYDAHSNKQIKSPHFDVWLQLFCETVNENFEGAIAAKAIEKAKELSMLFSWKLEELEGK
ncbi:MAG: group III truncated hemoglobin [Bacteroidia bacterium]